MENQQQILIETQFQDLTLTIRPNDTHEWLMETKLVAEGYGVDESAIRQHKKRNSSELIEGKHYLCVTNSHAQIKDANLGSMVREQIFWTKRGVIRLGFFIKSERARLFRDWAEDLIMKHLEKKEEYVTMDILKKILKQQDAKIHQYLDGLYKMINKKIDKNHTELQSLIHNLSTRVDKLEAHNFQTHALAQRNAYTYLIRKVGTNEYKIGKSIDPNKRLKELEIAGNQLELITTIQFKSETHALLWENTLKNFFEHRKIKGEWFSLTETEVNFVIEIAQSFEKLT